MFLLTIAKRRIWWNSYKCTFYTIRW